MIQSGYRVPNKGKNAQNTGALSQFIAPESNSTPVPKQFRGPLHGEEHLKTLNGPGESHEAPEGHVYEVATQLQHTRPTEQSEHVYTPFPDVRLVPIPNALLDSLDDMTGADVRLSVALMEAAYFRSDGEWRTSPAEHTISELQRRGLSMSRQSVRNAAQRLEDRGLIDTGERGNAHTFRWALSVPQSSYTLLPLALLREHDRIDSHNALALLLATYRATWGWTRNLTGTIEHRAVASLSTSDLEGMVGLSAPTIRKAAQELTQRGAVDRSRPEGSAPYWRPILSFFHNPHQKSYTPHISGKKESDRGMELCNLNNRASAGDCRTEVETEGENRRDTALSDRESRDVARLTAEPFGLPFHIAARQVSRWSAEVVQSTFGAFQRQQEQINNPGGWMRAALVQGWFSRSTTETTPCKNFGEGETTAMAVEETTLSHDEMCNAITLLGLDAEAFEIVEVPGSKKVRFRPTRAVAAKVKAGHQHTKQQEAARILITRREAYERTS